LEWVTPANELARAQGGTMASADRHVIWQSMERAEGDAKNATELNDRPSTDSNQ